MFTITLIPAGATDFDTQGRVLGRLDVPLSKDGLEQAHHAADQLKGIGIDAVYSGPCKACLQTAEAIASAHRLKPKKLELLQNLDQGLWQGMLIDEVREKQPKVYRMWQEEPEAVCPPDGETVESARDRLLKALKKLSRKHRSGNVAIVLAEPLASVLRCLLQECELGGLWRNSEESHHTPTSLVVSEQILAG